MAQVLTTDQKEMIRLPGQWGKYFLAIPEYHSIYTARLNGVPASNDMAAQISFDGGSGTLANVLPDTTLYVGTTAGAFDLGMCRIRKAPIAGTFYLGETSDVIWVDNAYLTVVDDYSLWQRSIHLSGVTPLMDWDIAYSDQHEDFDPVPAMGTHRVARLVGADVDVILGPSADAQAWVIASSIDSVAWTCDGATFDDDTAINPIATFDAAGTFLVYCEFTADNGKTFTGVRYVIIYDDDHPLIEDFLIRNGRGSYSSGKFSFDVVLLSNYSAATIRKRSLAILCVEDYAEVDGFGESVTMPGQIEGAENILGVGWISNIDNEHSSNIDEISFTVESAEYWLRQIRDYPSGLELKTGTAAAWTDMPGLNVDRAAWHFLHWRSTATRVMDFQRTEDERLATRFTTAKANLWERLIQITQPVIFASPHIDQFGRLFIEIEPQMIAEVDRDWPVVMELLPEDIEDGIRWVRRDVPAVSMLDFSGINVDSSGGASSYFAISPGHSYPQLGEEEAQDNYLVASQGDAIELCGLYYGWKNNPLDNLDIQFSHSMRPLGLFPRQFFSFDLDPADDPRGIGFTGNLIPREMSFSIDADSGFCATSVMFEPESFAGPAIKGDIITMETVDFSSPSMPSLKPLPSLPALPFIILPPTETNIAHPKKVVIIDKSVYNYGVLYTENFDATDPVYKTMNNGLSDTQRAEIANIFITPSGVMYLLCEEQTNTFPLSYKTVMVAQGLGGVWTQLYSWTEYAVEGTYYDAGIWGIGINPTVPDEVCIMGGRNWSHANDSIFGSLYLSIGNKDGVGSPIFQDDHISNGYADVLYSNGKWYALANERYSVGGALERPTVYTADADGSPLSLVNLTGLSFSFPLFARAHGTADIFWVWNDSGVAGYCEVVALVPTAKTGVDIGAMNGLGVSPTGTHAMAHAQTTDIPYKTNDNGGSWVSVAGALSTGYDVFENCRDNNRWIYGGGIIIRLTVDHGASGIDKMGNLGIITPLIDISGIRFIE